VNVRSIQICVDCHGTITPHNAGYPGKAGRPLLCGSCQDALRTKVQSLFPSGEWAWHEVHRMTHAEGENAW